MSSSNYHPMTFLRSAIVRDPFCLGDIGPEDVLRIENYFPELFKPPGSLDNPVPNYPKSAITTSQSNIKKSDVPIRPTSSQKFYTATTRKNVTGPSPPPRNLENPVVNYQKRPSTPITTSQLSLKNSDVLARPTPSRRFSTTTIRTSLTGPFTCSRGDRCGASAGPSTPAKPATTALPKSKPILKSTPSSRSKKLPVLQTKSEIVNRLPEEKPALVQTTAQLIEQLMLTRKLASKYEKDGKFSKSSINSKVVTPAAMGKGVRVKHRESKSRRTINPEISTDAHILEQIAEDLVRVELLKCMHNETGEPNSTQVNLEPLHQNNEGRMLNANARSTPIMGEKPEIKIRLTESAANPSLSLTTMNSIQTSVPNPQQNSTKPTKSSSEELNVHFEKSAVKKKKKKKTSKSASSSTSKMSEECTPERSSNKADRAKHRRSSNRRTIFPNTPGDTHVLEQITEDLIRAEVLKYIHNETGEPNSAHVNLEPLDQSNGGRRLTPIVEEISEVLITPDLTPPPAPKVVQGYWNGYGPRQPNVSDVEVTEASVSTPLPTPSQQRRSLRDEILKIAKSNKFHSHDTTDCSSMSDFVFSDAERISKPKVQEKSPNDSYNGPGLFEIKTPEWTPIGSLSELAGNLSLTIDSVKTPVPTPRLNSTKSKKSSSEDLNVHFERSTIQKTKAKTKTTPRSASRSRSISRISEECTPDKSPKSPKSFAEYLSDFEKSVTSGFNRLYSEIMSDGEFLGDPYNSPGQLSVSMTDRSPGVYLSDIDTEDLSLSGIETITEDTSTSATPTFSAGEHRS